MDLPNLGLTEARLVNSVHLYSKIANFSAILDDLLLCRDYSTGLHRYLHVIRVEQRLIMQSVFDGDKIQVQGPKFHGLHPIFKRVGSDFRGTRRGPERSRSNVIHASDDIIETGKVYSEPGEINN